jgi:hypothetical protein
MTTSPDRQTFREAVAAVAEKARATLPVSTNGRIESAARLVLLHDVTPQADGSILVGSSTDPLKQYRLEGATCTCQDFTHGQAPDGWCQHRLAAGIAKRVQQELAAAAPIDVTPTALPPEPQAPACEVPAIMSTTLTIEGRQVEVKLCDTDDSRLLARLRTLLQQFPVPEAAPVVPGEGWCHPHGVQMKWNAGKEGKAGWYSHKSPEGTWCKGKGVSRG